MLPTKILQLELMIFISKCLILLNLNKKLFDLFSISKSQFLAPNANCPINIDSRIMAITKSKMENPDRHTYDEARVI